jgi:hypothetical protein
MAINLESWILQPFQSKGMGGTGPAYSFHMAVLHVAPPKIFPYRAEVFKDIGLGSDHPTTFEGMSFAFAMERDLQTSPKCIFWGTPGANITHFQLGDFPSKPPGASGVFFGA